MLLDFEGKYKSVKAQNNAVYGQNYRIPLDSIALDFIFENDLNDCPIETKAIIQGIILELQKYAESAGFIPFEMFINIIMQECKRSNSAGLMIFANKLLKYKQKKIFADNKKQFEIINNCSSSLKIDMSEVDDSFYPLIFSSIISNTDKKFYVLSDINEENSTSSVLKNIYEKQNVRLIPVIKHDCKFLGKIKSNTSNMAVFAPVSKQKTEEPYGLFLDSISNDKFILWGENTLFIPIIVSLSEMLNNFKEGLLGYSTADDVTEEDLNDLDRINLQAIREAIRAENVTEEDLDSLNELRERPQIIEEEETTENNYRINEEENQEQYNSAPDESVRQQYQQTQPQQNYQQPVQQNNNTVQNSEPVRTAPQKPMPNPDTIPVYEPKEPERQTNITFFEGRHTKWFKLLLHNEGMKKCHSLLPKTVIYNRVNEINNKNHPYNIDTTTISLYL